MNRLLSVILFFYQYVLGCHWYADALPRVKARKILPDILSKEGVAAMIDSIHNVFWKAMIMTTYSAGLRNSEVRNLKVTDVDRKRMILVIRNGKGGVDRHAILFPLTLKCLETYWRLFRQGKKTQSDYLFLGTKNSHNAELNKCMTHTALGYIFEGAAEFAGTKKNYSAFASLCICDSPA